MESRRIVWKETAIMAIGEAICTAAMVGVFALLGDLKVHTVWSGLAGCLVIIVNYFFMAITVSLSADRAAQGDIRQAQNMIRASSVVRLLIMAAVLFVGIKLGANGIALVLPLAFQRPILMLAEFFRKKG